MPEDWFCSQHLASVLSSVVAGLAEAGSRLRQAYSGKAGLRLRGLKSPLARGVARSDGVCDRSFHTI